MFTLASFGAAFILILPVELPDKTLVATLLLTTRYRPGPVFLGVSAAFAVQCGIAVAFGGVLTLLPDRVVAGLVAALFGAGAAVLLREGFSDQDDDEATAEANGADEVPPWRAAAISFGVLFAAEWGDASQLATAALTARTGDPLSVGLGAWLALVIVAGIAVLLGQRITHRMPTHLIQRLAGGVFTVFALFAVYELIRG